VVWTLKHAKEPSSPGVKIWLPREIGVAYTRDRYNAGSQAGFYTLDYRRLIETMRVKVYPGKNQVLMLISKDSLDAYYGKRKGEKNG
jgi:hypothetical protein